MPVMVDGVEYLTAAEAAAALGVGERDVAEWRRAAAALVIPYEIGRASCRERV